MTVFVDAIRMWQSGEWCHMWTDGDAEELHRFAFSIGLHRSWAQHKPKSVISVHYDLRPDKRAQAVKAGAREVSLLAWLREHRIKSKSS